ncbi:hypothetical protein GCM10027320_23700 [Massilia solisilvae]
MPRGAADGEDLAALNPQADVVEGMDQHLPGPEAAMDAGQFYKCAITVRNHFRLAMKSLDVSSRHLFAGGAVDVTQRQL